VIIVDDFPDFFRSFSANCCHGVAKDTWGVDKSKVAIIICKFVINYPVRIPYNRNLLITCMKFQKK
jgi:hypothetical protein